MDSSPKAEGFSLRSPHMAQIASTVAMPDLALPRLSLRRNFAWMLAGNVIFAAAQWAMLIALTKVGSPEMVGQFAIALAIGNPILLLTNLHLRSVQTTDARGEFIFQEYFQLRMVTTALAMVLILVWAVLSGFRTETASIIVAVGIAKGIEAISDILHGVFQAKERIDFIAVSLAWRGVLSLLAFIMTMHWTQSLLCGVISTAVVALVMLLRFDLPRCRGLMASLRSTSAVSGWDRARLWGLAWLALPLGLGQMLRGLEISIPRYLIESRFGERELGLFAAIAYLTVAGAQVINALGQSASARLAQQYAAGDAAAFRRLLGRLLALGGTIGCGGFLVSLFAGRALLNFFYTTDYARHTSLLCWMMAAAGVTYAYVFLGTALNAMRLYRPRLALHALTIPTLLASCAILVPWHGLRGVAEAICFSELVAASAYLMLVRRAWRKV